MVYFIEVHHLISLPDISKWSTNNVIDLSFLFADCSSLKSWADILYRNINILLNNDFELTTTSLDDIIYGFNIFLNNRFEEIYSKIASFIYVAIESAGKYFANDFMIQIRKNVNLV